MIAWILVGCVGFGLLMTASVADHPVRDPLGMIGAALTVVGLFGGMLW